MNYSKQTLETSEDDSFSHCIAFNILNASEVALQIPFELFRNPRKGHDRNRNIEKFQLFSAFHCVSMAIELLLKSKIADIDYKHLLSRNQKASREKIIDGDFKSVNFEDCIKIIEINSKIRFGKKIKESIARIRDARNKTAHYYADIKTSEYIDYIALGLNAYTTIYRMYVKDELHDIYDRTENFEIELSNFEEFVKLQVEDCIEAKKINKTILEKCDECPKCLSWNYVPVADGKFCLLCGHEYYDEQT